MIYRGPGAPAPKYCNAACKHRFHSGHKPRKHVFTAEMDAKIIKLYLERVKMGWKKDRYKGPVKKLAERFGMPWWAVGKRAVELGVVPVQKKEPPWSDTEIWILKQCAHRSTPVIQKYLKRAGYRRSQQGIQLKRKHLHLSRATMNGYTMRSLARLFGIDAHSIMRWITRGWLTAQRRGTARTESQGGDEWYIRPEWVREFIVANVAVIDFRKVDKYWMVEILTKVQGEEAQGSRFKGSEVTESMDFDDPDEEYGVSSEVIDMFDEAQGML